MHAGQVDLDPQLTEGERQLILKRLLCLLQAVIEARTGQRIRAIEVLDKVAYDFSGKYQLRIWGESGQIGNSILDDVALPDIASYTTVFPHRRLEGTQYHFLTWKAMQSVPIVNKEYVVDLFGIPVIPHDKLTDEEATRIFHKVLALKSQGNVAVYNSSVVDEVGSLLGLDADVFPSVTVLQGDIIRQQGADFVSYALKTFPQPLYKLVVVEGELRAIPVRERHLPE
jgi:hypothetical protein